MRAPSTAGVPTPSTEHLESKAYDVSLQGCAEYLRFKVPIVTLSGAAVGASVGFYTGGLTALYGYGYGIGGGVCCTAFYGGTYWLQYMRQKDDYINYMISGGVNASWLVAGMQGPRRGVLGLLCGALAGGVYKITGDYMYSTARTAWVEHRLHGLYKSTPKVLAARRPAFAPRDKESLEEMEKRVRQRREASKSIIPSQFLGSSSGSKDKQS